MKHQNQNRQVNIECLRLLAMFMVVSLHYFYKGNFLPELPSASGAKNYVWLLEAFAVVAVNVYVLVSGYFLIKTQFSIMRIVALWGQVLFYSIGITLVLLATNIIEIQQFTIYDFLIALLPVFMGHYWFATFYILLLLLIPFLNEGIKHMNQKQYGQLLVCLLLITSVVPSIVPVELSLDAKGFEDLLWFMVLYLIAGYIRLYGFPWITTKSKAFAIYILSSLGIFVWMNGINWVNINLGKLESKIIMSYQYNHILVLVSSISLFLLFLYWKGVNGRAGKVINWLAQGTFGVYLFHEHIFLKYEWMHWFGELPESFQWLHYILSAITIMVIGIGLDWMRRQLFALLAKIGTRFGEKN